MAGFLSVPNFRRNKRGRVGAMTPMRQPAPTVSLPKAAARIAEAQPASLSVKQKRATATAKQQKTTPVETATPKSGRRIGAKAPKGSSTLPPRIPDIMMPMAPTHWRGNFTSKTIEFQDEVSPPGPIILDYECRQNGSTKRLDTYKKMYKGSNYELVTPSLYVGGAQQQKDKKLQPSSMVGFGRSNVMWPYAWHDYVSTGPNQLTSKTGCFTRTQIENTFKAVFANLDPSTDVDATLVALEKSIGGDQRIDFPVDYIECQYKYLNDNISLPLEISLYLCSPKRNMTASHSPMYDWFTPFNQGNDSEHMLANYWYNPVLTAANDVMFQSDPNGVVSNVGMVSNAPNILTASTEVVPEATPQGYSSKFRRNWDVKHVQKVVLQPQQELILNLKVKMSQLLDFKKFLSYDTNGDKFELFEDMTLFPMIKFKGLDTVSVSAGLKRVDDSTVTNRFLTTTAPRSGPGMLSSTMSTSARVYVTSNFPRGFESQIRIETVLNCFDTTKRELLPYDSFERGENYPYYNVNDNLGYFSGEPNPPGSNVYYTTVVELNTKAGVGLVPTTDPGLQAAASNLLPVIDSNKNWGTLNINTITRNILRAAESDIKKS